MEANRNILIVEDDKDLADILFTELKREGFEANTANDGRIGLNEALSGKYDLLLLDIRMPGVSGLEICHRVRTTANTAKIPIIMVTANGSDSDVTLGLEMGADDYVVKPFSLPQLVTRVRAVLRRSLDTSLGAHDKIRNVGPLVLDLVAHEAKLDNKPVDFTLAEFNILWALAGQPGRVFPRTELLQHVNSKDHELTERNIDVHVMSIRKKIGEHGALIQTVRGIGYKLLKGTEI